MLEDQELQSRGDASHPTQPHNLNSAPGKENPAVYPALGRDLESIRHTGALFSEKGLCTPLAPGVGGGRGGTGGLDRKAGQTFSTKTLFRLIHRLIGLEGTARII